MFGLGRRQSYDQGHAHGAVPSGALTVEVDGVAHRLRPGDPIPYDSMRPTASPASTARRRPRSGSNAAEPAGAGTNSDGDYRRSSRT